MSFRLDASDLINGLLSFGESRVPYALEMYCSTIAKQFESYAKNNRPWTDRTSRARLGLTGYYKKVPNGYRIYIAHTVDYGIWLEYANEKNYAILEPTVRLKGPDAVKGLKTLFNNI